MTKTATSDPLETALTEAAPGESAHEEIARLRAWIATLQATVAEQEKSIAFLHDMLAERWFEVAS